MYGVAVPSLLKQLQGNFVQKSLCQYQQLCRANSKFDCSTPLCYPDWVLIEGCQKTAALHVADPCCVQTTVQTLHLSYKPDYNTAAVGSHTRAATLSVTL